MLFNKSLFASVLVMALSSQAYAHAVITPAIQVQGTPVRNDAKQPSTNAPCGAGVNIAASAKTAQTVAAQGNSFSVNVQNFNGGKDGSRQIVAAKMQVDATGTGKSFKTGGTVTKNGDLAPTDNGQQQVTATLPAGTTCTGGADGKSCLVSMTTAGGFGNCVMVSQAGGGAAGAAGAAAGAAAGNAAASGASAATGQGKHHKGGKNGAKAKAGGGAKNNAAKAKAAGGAKNNNAAAKGAKKAMMKARRSWASRHQVRALVPELA